MSFSTLWPRIAMRLTQLTAQLLDAKKRELAQVKWTEGEANIDTKYSKLARLCCMEAWPTIKEEFPELNDFTLTCKSPDITVSLLNGQKHVVSAKIELKQGKVDVIPGSTIGKLDIDQPVIFCLRNESDKTFTIRYGQYHSCMHESDTDLFQDRTPRPNVNYLKLTDILSSVEYVHKEKGNWIERYAECALNRVKGNNTSWQDDLTAAILRRFVEQTSVEEFTRMKHPLQ